MSTLRTVPLAAAAVLAGCTTVNPPLLFGDHQTYGLHLGNDTASAGAAVSLGYKARSLAVVPLSAVDHEGHARTIVGKDPDNGDALSVFAVFENRAASGDDAAGAAAADATVSLNQVFSTGMAAQHLTLGYQCRYQRRPAAECDKPASPPRPTVAPDQQTAAKKHAPDAPQTDRPYQAPLVFLKTDVLGIDIGGSVAEKGAQFALGYAGRNVALIPVAIESAGGRMESVLTSHKDGRTQDAYSVLGQFKANSSTTRLRLGLDRYFATGIAAQNLAVGLKAVVADDVAPAAAPATRRDTTASAAATPPGR